MESKTTKPGWRIGTDCAGECSDPGSEFCRCYRATNVEASLRGPETSAPLDHLIKKGAYFYRPNRQGYTSDPRVAGRYTKADAEREASVEPWHMSAVPVADLPADPRPRATITRAEVLSVDAVNAVLAAEYRMRKNARYFAWSNERRTQYALGKAFDAIVAARAGNRADPCVLDVTRKGLRSGRRN